MPSFRSFDGYMIGYAYHPGKGRAIVFLHALGFDWTYWKKSFEYFGNRGHSVLAVTLRGHSRSRAWMGSISMEDHVRDLKLLFSELRIRNPILVGASLGGAVAAAYHAGNREAICICINTPFSTARQLRAYVKALALLAAPLAALDFLPRPRLGFDFSKSRVTNNVLMSLKAALKLNTYGFWLNYCCLRNSGQLPSKGCITVNSSKDEVISPLARPEYSVEGNHNCAVSSSARINSLLERIIRR